MRNIFYRFTAVALSVILTAGIFYFNVPFAYATTTTFTTSGIWTAPAGVTSVQVNAWGAGGGGANGVVSVSGGNGGGGGGAYSALNAFSVTPGNMYTVTVGIGGIANASGTDSMFSASSTLLAKGGGPGVHNTPNGTNSTAPGGLGGIAANGNGDVKLSGGAGGRGDDANDSSDGGGGGGGAGTTGAGGAATFNSGDGGSNQQIGGIGTSVGGGNGGNGWNGGTPGAGNTIGGGGGGSTGTATNGGVGARGEVDITYGAAANLGPATVTITAPFIVRNNTIIK